MSIVFPRFHYPSEGKANPFMEKINAQITQWINEYTCIADDLKKELKKAQFGYLSSRVFPNASYEQLTVGSRYFLWVFVHDDHWGPLPASELKPICDNLVDILNGKGRRPHANEIYQQLAIIREEALPYATPDWMKRFTADMKDYFDAMLTDAAYSYNATVTYPSLEEYLPLRDSICGARSTATMGELCSGTILPQAIFEHPYIQAIRQAMVRILGIRNDLSSAFKEKADREAMNILLVIQQERKCGFQEALDIACDLHAKALEELLRLCANVPDFGALTELIGKYVEQIKLQTEGHNAWYVYSHRYGVNENEQRHYNNPEILSVVL
ncbi:terpene synthase family protein [Chitinophaga nivalis]|uniref:Terpene synthase n=1 Tax=Chitinophaga nivalis TaxID=2991709 RepID=A0ABT3IJF1_9BACT|nr:hypothetical protein [Chitinophaga nivalis]MCW3466240.1 hypothetical protein [Chitinophaga nivalis]MCW3484069.1 hypothetical protein [Chitinophaga nivalis]